MYHDILKVKPLPTPCYIALCWLSIFGSSFGLCQTFPMSRLCTLWAPPWCLQAQSKKDCGNVETWKLRHFYYGMSWRLSCDKITTNVCATFTTKSMQHVRPLSFAVLHRHDWPLLADLPLPYVQTTGKVHRNTLTYRTERALFMFQRSRMLPSFNSCDRHFCLWVVIFSNVWTFYGNFGICKFQGRIYWSFCGTSRVSTELAFSVPERLQACMAMHCTTYLIYACICMCACIYL